MQWQVEILAPMQKKIGLYLKELYIPIVGLDIEG